jgi:hydrocephalus-inducing protein
VTYRLSTKELDFDTVPYNESSSRDFFIENVGKVPFEFSINLNTVSRPGLIDCSHMKGKVLAGEKFKITVKFFAGIPDNIREMFLVECSHFPAERFTVKAVGIYPAALLSFPRADDDQFQSCFDDVRKQLENKKVDYSAQFHGVDALRLMPTIPAKFVDREKVAIREKETFVMEVEAECDRQNLCTKIITIVDQQVNNANSPSGLSFIEPPALSESRSPPKENPKDLGKSSKKAGLNATTGDANTTSNTQMKVNGVNISLDNIQLCTYVCDFGNVILGGSKKRSFRLTNVGKLPINFTLDKKLLNQAGISFDQDKGVKIMPNTSQLFTVVFTSRKQQKFGRTHFMIPIDIKNGPTYMIDFIANLTQPELNMSTDNLDFEKVAINTRKTIKLRIENLKEVALEWWYHNPDPNQGRKPDPNSASDKKKETEFFQVWPLAGTLLPG